MTSAAHQSAASTKANASKAAGVTAREVQRTSASRFAVGVAGNMAVQRAFGALGLSAGDTIQRKCVGAAGGCECSTCSLNPEELAAAGIQRMAIRPVDDPLEHEADRMADAVVSQPPGRPIAPTGMAASALQRKPLGPGAQSTGATGAATKALVGGRPLDGALHRDLSGRFGQDLGSVRIHDDGVADTAATALNAAAFTVGDHIVFGAGRFAPDTDQGRRLLAHELTHVMQQRGGAAAGVQRQVLDGAASSSTPAAEWMEVTGPYTSGDIQLLGGERVEAIATPADPTMLRVQLGAPYQHAYEPFDMPRNLVRSSSSSSSAGSPSGALAPLSARIASFKQLVLTTARQRLLNNRTNLSLWAALVDRVLSADDIRAMGLAQEGERGADLYFRIQDESNPIRRELYAGQLFGRYRACTGCHLEQHAWAAESERNPFDPNWQSPNARRTGQWSIPSRDRAILESFAPRFPQPETPVSQLSDSDMAAVVAYVQAMGGDTAPRTTAATTAGEGSHGSSTIASHGAATTTTSTVAPTATPSTIARVGTYRPPRGSSEAHIQGLFPNPSQVREALARVQPVIEALGPSGYKVLPEGILSQLETGDPETLRQQIQEHIAQRRTDYLTLIGMIDRGEIEYHHFQPILQSLLQTAAADVRSAIQTELEDRGFWQTVESIVVAGLSVLALILTIFPPTSALGIAAFAALEIGLGAYSIHHGSEMVQTGTAYRLGTGANDVFSPAQQAMGDDMVFGGYLSIVGGFMQVLSGTARAATLGAEVSAQSTGTALATRSTTAVTTEGAAAATAQRGSFTATMQADGSIVITNAQRPDLVLIVRGDNATLYQMLGEGGGMRVVRSATVPRGPVAVEPPPALSGPPTSPPLLGMGGPIGGGPTGAVRTVAATSDTIIVDTQTVRALEQGVAGTIPADQAALQRAYTETMAMIESQPAAARGVTVTPRTLGELAEGTPVQGVTQVLPEVTASAAEQQTVMTRLTELGVGGAGGVGDRTIVMQALMSPRAGGIPTLVTADRQMINGLARAAGVDPARLGRYATVAEHFYYTQGSSTFTVTIEGFTLRVRPVQAVRQGLR